LTKNIDLECKNNEGWTPMHYICRYGDDDIIKFAINIGLKLNNHNDYGWSPLHYIFYFGSENIINYVIENCSLDVLENKTNDGLYPIHIVTQRNLSNIIKKMIIRGINYEIQGPNGLRMSHIICQNSTFEMLHYIII
jgi:ankyrin repeat protein